MSNAERYEAPTNPRSERERLKQTIRFLSKEFNEVLSLLGETEDLQWMRPSSGDKVRGPKNTINDPTGETAVDARRLALRDQRRKAIREIEKFEKAMLGCRRGLAKAIDNFE